VAINSSSYHLSIPSLLQQDRRCGRGKESGMRKNELKYGGFVLCNKSESEGEKGRGVGKGTKNPGFYK